MTATSNDLVVEQLAKRFATHSPAVANASFTAPAGGITTLLGPSGSGKTTVLRIIAGLETADAGRVRVGSADVTEVPVQKRGFGFVFQGFALFGHMTVADNIAFGLRTHRVPRAEANNRVAELLQLVQLEDYGQRYPAQLSGGQRQRVGLARALAPRPMVLLLDEPFGALDTRVRVELREWLRRLHEATHLTTILVTHDQEEALDLSDQLVIMDGGKIQQVGAPAEIYERPATPFVASFLGVANVLRGQVRAGRATMGRCPCKLPPTSATAHPCGSLFAPTTYASCPTRAPPCPRAPTTPSSGVWSAWAPTSSLTSACPTATSSPFMFPDASSPI